MTTLYISINTARDNIIRAVELDDYDDIDISRLTLVYTKSGGITVEVETEDDAVLGTIENVYLELSLEVKNDAESKEGNSTN